MTFVRFIMFCTDAVKQFLSRNCPHTAGAISFYTLFSMFPLFLAITIGLTYVFGPRTPQEEIDLAERIAEAIPVSHGFVSETIQDVTSARDEIAIVSVIGLLWAATAMFGALRKGINAAWGIQRTRPFLKERLIDFGLVLGAGVLLLLVLFSATAFGVLRQITAEVAPESGVFSGLLWGLLPRLLSPVLTFLTFLVLYRFLPNTEVKTRDVWPWALLASLALDGVNLGFVWYVSTFPHYNLLYGSVGAVLALLTWVYLAAIIVLFGALICSRYCAYVANIETEDKSWRLLWSGFSRVRLRVVESNGPA